MVWVSIGEEVGLRVKSEGTQQLILEGSSGAYVVLNGKDLIKLRSASIWNEDRVSICWRSRI